MFDWKIGMDNKHKTSAVKEKKRKLRQLINKMIFFTQISTIKDWHWINNNDEHFSVEN